MDTTGKYHVHILVILLLERLHAVCRPNVRFVGARCYADGATHGVGDLVPICRCDLVHVEKTLVLLSKEMDDRTGSGTDFAQFVCLGAFVEDKSVSGHNLFVFHEVVIKTARL